MRTHVLLRAMAWVLFLAACVMLGVFFYLVYLADPTRAAGSFIVMLLFGFFSFLMSLAADDLDFSNIVR